MTDIMTELCGHVPETHRSARGPDGLAPEQ